jgi:hypothetical protein
VPTVLLGNQSVTEPYKPDEGTDETLIRSRADLGRRVTAMNLNEVDGDDNPSRGMNLTMAARLWAMHSDEAPAWVESDDELLSALIADHYGCDIGRPDDWQEG